MKKFLVAVILTLVCFCSCSTTHKMITSIGNIYTYNSNGEIQNTYKDIVISKIDGDYKTNIFKPFGLNFVDESTGKIVVIGSAVPYKIEYISHDTSLIYGKPAEYWDNLRNKRNVLEKQISLKKAYLSKIDKGSSEYSRISKDIEFLESELYTVNYELWFE